MTSEGRPCQSTCCPLAPGRATGPKPGALAGGWAISTLDRTAPVPSLDQASWEHSPNVLTLRLGFSTRGRTDLQSRSPWGQKRRLLPLRILRKPVQAALRQISVPGCNTRYKAPHADETAVKLPIFKGKAWRTSNPRRRTTWRAPGIGLLPCFVRPPHQVCLDAS